MSHITTDSVLIVEDEPKIARLVADYLEGSGYATHHLDHGDTVLPGSSPRRHRPSWSCWT